MRRAAVPCGATILNVDDHESARYAKSRILQAAGYRVIEASTGADALRLVREVMPQLALIDVKLPDMDGLQICRTVKDDPATNSVMVLLISAQAVRRQDRVTGLEEGADGYLVEPVEADELLATVKALLRLYLSDQRLELALKATNDVVYEWDAETDTFRWNDAGSEAFGWTDPSAAPVSSEWRRDRIHPEDRDDMEAAFSAKLVDRTVEDISGEYRFQKTDGSYAVVHDRARVVRDARGSAVRMIGAMRDMTQRLAHECQLRESEGRLQVLAGRLEQLVEDRTRELVHSQTKLRALSRELNLTEQRERKRLAIELHDHLAQLLVLSRLKLSQAKRAMGDRGTQFVVQAEEALDDALRYTRTLVADLSPPVLRDFGLYAGLRWLSDYMQRHDLTVRANLPASGAAPPLPEDHAVLVFQSVRELLLNAAKHASAGSADLLVEERDGILYIEVRDEGRGFRPDAASAGESTDADLSKFGLFSIQERMRAVGGAFAIESAPGRGTRAMLTLPLASHVSIGRAESVQAAIPGGSPSRGDHRAVHERDPRIRVLLVDDHAMVRQGLRSLLESYADVDIVGEAHDGEKALAELDRLQPTVIVMDINMPRLDGIQATARVKARAPDTAVIGLSVNASDNNRTAMLRAGAAKVLTKEAAVEHLYQAIVEVCRPA